MIENTQAINAFAVALAKCNTPQAIEGAVSQYMRQWAASERQVKIYPNGLAKVQVLDKNLAPIAEYTRPAKEVWSEHQDSDGHTICELTSLRCLVEYAGQIETVATEDQSDDVFGPDTRTVMQRRAGVVRQLRQLAALANKLAEKIDS
jgi:hypothetical protein